MDPSIRNDVETMCVFPGRNLLRLPLKTDGKDKMDCTKKYFKRRPNVTCFISLQCPCEHPKIIGFTLIKEVESLVMAISTLIAFLRFPPRTIWYDNACNMYDSALLRMPYLLRTCYLMVYRFHYHGHTCSNHFNPNRYLTLLKQRSTAAEVLNALLKKFCGFIRYLKRQNVKPYLRILFAIHNFKSLVKDGLNRKELPLVDFTKYYNTQFVCSCVLCRVMVEDHAWERATVLSVSFLPVHDGLHDLRPEVSDLDVHAAMEEGHTNGERDGSADGSYRHDDEGEEHEVVQDSALEEDGGL